MFPAQTIERAGGGFEQFGLASRSSLGREMNEAMVEDSLPRLKIQNRKRAALAFSSVLARSSLMRADQSTYRI
jgi:hypothetical protein